MTGKRRKRPWRVRLKERTLARVPGNTVAAGEVFKRIGFEDQIRLVRELVRTRAAELCRAYSGVVAISHGLRRRRIPGTKKREVVPEPCVTFVVSRKWPRKRGPRHQRLPEQLFTYCDVEGARTLCAIRTDVEDVRERASIRPEAAPQKIVADAGVAEADGVITCTIRRSTAAGSYAVSCQHVFSVTEVLPPAHFRTVTVNISDDGQVGTTEDVRGLFSDAVAHSLDCQVARASSEERLRAARGDVDIEGYITSSDQALAFSRCWIITFDGPIEAYVKEPLGDEYGIDYKNRGVHDIRHERLLLLHTTRPSKKGYSGSPVLTREDGGTLIGMHIGGNQADLSIVVPAWHMLDPTRYVGTLTGEIWRVLRKSE